MIVFPGVRSFADREKAYPALKLGSWVGLPASFLALAAVFADQHHNKYSVDCRNNVYTLGATTKTGY